MLMTFDIVHFSPVTMSKHRHVPTVFHTLERLNVHPQNITLHFVLPTSALTVWEILI